MGGLFWKSKKVNVSFGRDSKDIIVRVVPFWYEGFGLMFTRKKTAKPLLFSYPFSSRMTIFSLFIPYDFIVLWVDSLGKIVGIKIVKPGEDGIEPGIKFKKLIEIPISEKHKDIVDFILKNKKKLEISKIIVGKINS